MPRKVVTSAFGADSAINLADHGSAPCLNWPQLGTTAAGNKHIDREGLAILKLVGLVLVGTSPVGFSSVRYPDMSEDSEGSSQVCSHPEVSLWASARYHTTR